MSEDLEKLALNFFSLIKDESADNETRIKRTIKAINFIRTYPDVLGYILNHYEGRRTEKEISAGYSLAIFLRSIRQSAAHSELFRD